MFERIEVSRPVALQRRSSGGTRGVPILTAGGIVALTEKQCEAAAQKLRERARAELCDHKDQVSEKRKRTMAPHAAAGATFGVFARRWRAVQVGLGRPLTRPKCGKA